MNYYNPYLFNMPTTFSVPKAGGLFSNLFRGGGLKLGSIINGTQRALGFANQLIPVVKQVQPMFKNAKTMFRVMNEFKKTDTNNTSYVKNTNNNYTNSSSNNNSNSNTKSITNNTYQSQGPTFFI